jgi:hypothetical protein
MFRLVIRVAKFALVLAAMAVVCTISWQLVGERLYDCTDDGFLGFWRPGNWVHSWPQHPVAVVPQVVHDRSMSEPDTIKEGWTVARLWGLWSVFVGVSLVVSLFGAWIPWGPRRPPSAVEE